jgi:AraC-like DNA-binding protein
LKIDYPDIIYFAIVGIGIINGLLLSVYLWIQKKGSSPADKLLALLIFFNSVILICSLLVTVTYIRTNFNPMPFGAFFIYLAYFNALLCLGPSLLLYFKAATIKEFVFRKKYWLNVILNLVITPVFLFCIYYKPKYHEYIIDSIYVAVLIAFLVYIILTVRRFIRLLKLYRAKQTTCEKSDLVLLGVIVSSVILIWLLHAVNATCSGFHIHTLLAELTSMLIFYLIIAGLFYNKIGTLHGSNEKYKSSRLSDEDVKQHFDKLINYILKEQPYKESEVTLPGLAKALVIQPHLLSQVINSKTGKSFPDFINSFRIEEAKKMLKDHKNDNLTIASIAYDCGFNTLSAFNTAFKKQTKITPSQFRSQKI